MQVGSRSGDLVACIEVGPFKVQKYVRSRYACNLLAGRRYVLTEPQSVLPCNSSL